MKRSLLFFCAMGLAVNAFADSRSVEQYLAEGKTLFAQREDATKNDSAIAAFEAGATVAQAGSQQKFDALVLLSRAYYWKGSHQSTKDAKLAIFEKGRATAELAQKEKPDFAEGYYYYGINLARWAEAKGVFESLGRKKELVDSMENAQSRDQAVNDEKGQPMSGELIDGNGPDRVLGRVYFKLPGFAGGDRKQSVKYLNKAVLSSPKVPLNYVYLAESLSKGDATEKAKACEMLKAVVALNPATLIADRVPEAKEEIADGLKLKGEICK